MRTDQENKDSSYFIYVFTIVFALFWMPMFLCLRCASVPKLRCLIHYKCNIYGKNINKNDRKVIKNVTYILSVTTDFKSEWGKVDFHLNLILYSAYEYL